MIKTLGISLRLENAYTVNGIIYGLKQIPLVKKLLPADLYRSKGLKIFAQVITILIDILSIFAYKMLYLILMVMAAAGLIIASNGNDALRPAIFIYILLFLTIIGAFLNTHIFESSNSKYYAIVLMRMNPRNYAVANYEFYLLELIVGFLPFTIIFGKMVGLPLWLCFLIPFGIAGFKVIYTAFVLKRYEKRTDYSVIKKNPGKRLLAVLILLIAAYVPCIFSLVLPIGVCAALFAAAFAGGLLCIPYLLRYKLYKQIYKEVLESPVSKTDMRKDMIKKNVEKNITADAGITSSKNGFEFLNDLFVKRHKNLLWSATAKISVVCAVLVAVCAALLILVPASREAVNPIPLKGLPYFAFIMYAINRGMGITQALFMNCDHSLLTYSVFKERSNILRLFRIRLREIIKINLVPALIIGCGLALILALSGGTEDPLNYIVLIVSVPCMSIFFSVHYLTIYYLLQPYNAGTEIKSGMYKVITSVTYIGCYILMQCRFSTMIFGLITIAFSVIYCVAACLLVYRFAPRTFRIRN